MFKRSRSIDISVPRGRSRSKGPMNADEPNMKRSRQAVPPTSSDYSVFGVDYGIIVRVPNTAMTKKDMKKREKDLDSLLLRLEEFNNRITELARLKNLNIKLKSDDPIQIKIDEYKSRFISRKKK